MPDATHTLPPLPGGPGRDRLLDDLERLVKSRDLFANQIVGMLDAIDDADDPRCSRAMDRGPDAQAARRAILQHSRAQWRQANAAVCDVLGRLDLLGVEL